jgi:hypothetical protein
LARIQINEAALTALRDCVLLCRDAHTDAAIERAVYDLILAAEIIRLRSQPTGHRLNTRVGIQCGEALTDGIQMHDEIKDHRTMKTPLLSTPWRRTPIVTILQELVHNRAEPHWVDWLVQQNVSFILSVT